MTNTLIKKPIISSDSHIMEPPDTYIARIDQEIQRQCSACRLAGERWRHLRRRGNEANHPMGLVAAAGVSAEGLATSAKFAKFADLHRGGWDPEARMADQDRDGVAAEVIYPSVGMILCNHPDRDYKKACFDAYNLWIAEYCGAHPDRLIGLGQTAMRTPEEGIEDLDEDEGDGTARSDDAGLSGPGRLRQPDLR